MKRVRFKTEDGEFVAGYKNLNNAVIELKKKGGDWCAEFKKWSGAKTYDQIKAVKGVIIPEYAKYTGQSKKQAQRYLKEEYGVTERFTDSEGKPCIEFKSFANYTKAEMREFIQGVLDHLEYDCNFIIDLETRRRLMIDDETGELTEV